MFCIRLLIKKIFERFYDLLNVKKENFAWVLINILEPLWHYSYSFYVVGFLLTVKNISYLGCIQFFIKFKKISCIVFYSANAYTVIESTKIH